MAFSDFKSIAEVQEEYQIKYTEANFIEYLDLKPAAQFLQELEFNEQHLDIFSSEASRGENVIYPVLREVYKHFANQYTLWSHKSISYDSKLTGTPDYLFSTRSELGKTVLGLPLVVVVSTEAEIWRYFPSPPDPSPRGRGAKENTRKFLLQYLEAKQNNFSEGWGQGLAELVAAQKLNQEEKLPVYGIVTDGELWQFGKLVGNLFTKQKDRITISDLNKLFGAIGFILLQS